MQNQVFERILAGEVVALAEGQLLQFQGFCSARSFPLEKLIDASITLFRIGREYSYQFLNYIDRHQLGKTAYNDYQHQGAKITIYNHLTGLVLAKAARQSEKTEHDKLMAEAKKYLNSSEKVRMTVDKSIILNRAFLHYYTGETTKALNLVTRIYEEIQKTKEGTHLLVTAMLMLAQIHFLRKNYQKSLDLYKKCLSTAKTLPARGRIGMAYCFFHLGKYEMARACFQRVVKLEPGCVEALVGIAIVFDKQENHLQYFEYINQAYRVDRRHPLVLLHLAEHYLFRRELHKSEKFSLQGLAGVQGGAKLQMVEQTCRNDYEQMKARFNNILGQINHINNNYLQAIRYYTLASGKKLIQNEISLAQCYIHPNTQNYIQAIKLLQQCYRIADSKQQRVLNDSYKLAAYLKSKVPPRNKDQLNAEHYYSQAIKFNRHDFDSKIEYANILVDINKLKALKLLEEAEKIQIALGNQVKCQLINNIAVFYLENQESEVCQEKLEVCLARLEGVVAEGEEEELRVQGLKLIVRFNYGVCMERRAKWHTARQVYEQILANNKYHIDSALRLAFVWSKLGSYRKTVELLEEIDRQSEPFRRVLRPQRFITPKAYLQHVGGSSSEAKQTLKILGKGKDIYSTLLQLCINYQGIMRKGVQMNVLKQFLRPSRQFCYKFCRQDHLATFGYMLLAIICLVDKKFTKTQGIQFFNSLKQFSSDQIPTILFNMGFFLLNYDDHDNSTLVLNLYKDKVGVNCLTDELIALNYLLDNNIPKAEQYTKRNILREPCNLKYKLQYSYLLERRSHQYYQRGNLRKKEVETRLQELRFCMNTHNFLAKVSIPDVIRGIECPELKERVKSIYTKVKACGEERKFYIKSYMDSFQKVLKDLAEEDSRRVLEEKQAASILQQEENQINLLRILEGEEESEDEEEKARKVLEGKRQRALEMARKKQEEINSAWENLKAIDQEMNSEKKSRKKPPKQPVVPGVTATRKREKRPKELEPEYDDDALPEDEHSFDEEEELDEIDPELDSNPHKKHKKDKKHKKHKKHKHKKHRRHSQEGEEGEDEDLVVGLGSDESMVSERREKKEEDDNDEEEELMKYMA